MNFVTDTHSLVWYFTEDARLSEKAADKIEVDLEMHDKLIFAINS